MLITSENPRLGRIWNHQRFTPFGSDGVVHLGKPLFVRGQMEPMEINPMTQKTKQGPRVVGKGLFLIYFFLFLFFGEKRTNPRKLY